MSVLRVVLHASAERDVGEALGYYERQAGPEIAQHWIRALEQAYESIRDWPESGSLRYAHELNIPGLRSKKLKGFPYLLFYTPRTDVIDVWRVLHAQRDIPPWMSLEEE